LVAPHLFISGRASARRGQLEQEFPDALDLMVVCMEAGLGLEAAFIRVGLEVVESHPRIAEAFGRVSDELRAGQGRAEALRSMADRTDIEPVRAFVALLIQTDALGTSIGRTLRTYAVEMRAHRFLRAEEKAMRIPVLMTVPLVACILPVVVTALLLPPILDVLRTIGPALAGHGQ
jgi:tight adherence protein C